MQPIFVLMTVLTIELPAVTSLNRNKMMILELGVQKEVAKRDVDVSEVDALSQHNSTVEDPPPTTPWYRTDCNLNMRLCFVPCPNGKRCVLDMSCKNRLCIDKPPLTTESAPTTTEDELGTILRPIEDRRCTFINRPIICLHGYCNKTHSGCECDKGWQERKCDMPCTLDCVHGSCDVDRPGELFIQPETVTEKDMKCNCHDGWQLPLCDERFPDLVDEAEKRTLKLGVSLGTILFVFMCLSAVVLILLWRKRVIVIMKLVYFFKLEEDDDGRLYDAYVSVSSSPEGLNFVHDTLCPRLESLGFRLYVQCRDQPIGESPSEGILKSMNQSRRTIMIITPDYLQNEWSKFECIIAQIETLKLHQRIIPIILKDISDERHNMDRTMKHILESVKCLKFPHLNDDQCNPVNKREVLKQKKENRFWKRLELTMPKKAKIACPETFTYINHV